MKDQIVALLDAALATVKRENFPELGVPEHVNLQRTRDASHGDFASNVALSMAKSAGVAPRELAELIVAALPASSALEKAEIAGPGFINFTLVKGTAQKLVLEILDAGDRYGCSDTGQGAKVIVEFVSANPTGPLHVGHGRGAAYGASVAALLQAVGYDVHKEYYVNDAGRQMDILGVSVWLRYLEARGVELAFPAAGYRGEYIRDIATTIDQTHGDSLLVAANDLTDGLPAEDVDKADAYIDALIARARELLGADRFDAVTRIAREDILADIRNDLEEFGVVMDKWFSEKSLTDDGTVDNALQRLGDMGNTYEKDGALWFRASDYDDDKDRVLVKANGLRTYITSDIAYHLDKRLRGFSTLLDVLGADHHGYVARVRAGLEAMGQPGDSLEVKLVQFVSLFEKGEKIAMTTRGGQFVTLRQLREEVGNDAARFFYVMRSIDQHLDFDLDLAKARRDENPVFYIQYAHARTCSVMAQLEHHGHHFSTDAARTSIELLTDDKEAALLKQLARYPEMVGIAARDRAPQTIVHYLRDLTSEYHSFYNACRIMVDDEALRNARAALNQATAQVIRNGLGLLGVSAPERM